MLVVPSFVPALAFFKLILNYLSCHLESFNELVVLFHVTMNRNILPTKMVQQIMTQMVIKFPYLVLLTQA